MQGAEAVLVGAAEQLGPALLQTLPAVWHHMSALLMSPGSPPDQLAAPPLAADPQVGAPLKIFLRMCARSQHIRC